MMALIGNEARISCDGGDKNCGVRSASVRLARDTMPKSLIAHARGYSELGFRVLPVHTVRNGVCTCRLGGSCKHAGKHPQTRRGIHDASTNEKEIERWWKRSPDANVGIATGREAGIFVIDIDPRNGGTESLARLAARLGELPPTPDAQTGGGGRHLFLSYPASHVGSPSRVEPGIDIKG